MDLVPKTYYDPTPQRRGTSTQLARVHDQSLVTCAAIEAGEGNAAYVVERRIVHGYQLAAHTVNHATGLNHLVTQVTRDKPGLEATLRDIEETVAFAAKSIIYQYMTR